MRVKLESIFEQNEILVCCKMDSDLPSLKPESGQNGIKQNETLSLAKDFRRCKFSTQVCMVCALCRTLQGYFILALQSFVFHLMSFLVLLIVELSVLV